MFDFIKRKVTMSMFNSSLGYVENLPLSIQIQIHGRLRMESERCFSFPDYESSVAYVRRQCQLALAMRHAAVARGARSESDPDWAEAALLEAFYSVLLTGDRKAIYQMRDNLALWELRIMRLEQGML